MGWQPFQSVGRRFSSSPLLIPLVAFQDLARRRVLEHPRAEAMALAAGDAPRIDATGGKLTIGEGPVYVCLEE